MIPNLSGPADPLEELAGHHGPPYRKTHFRDKKQPCFFIPRNHVDGVPKSAKMGKLIQREVMNVHVRISAFEMFETDVMVNSGL